MHNGITVLAGLGLLYAGLRLLTDSYRRLAGRRIDDAVRRGLGGPLSAWLVGVAVGAVARHAGTITLTAGGLLSTGRATPGRVLALQCGAAVGTAFLVFLVPVHLYAMLGGVAAVAAALFLLDPRHPDQIRFAAAAAVAAAVMFAGIVTARSGGHALAADPATYAWLLELTRSPAAGLLIGAVVGALTLSAWHAAILAIVLITPGVLAPATVAFALVGALAGATLAEAATIGRLGGRMRRLVAVQLAPRLAAPALAAAALAAAGDRLPLSADHDLAVLYLAIQLLTGLCLAVWIGPRAAVMAGEAHGHDALAAPRYLFDVDAVDPETALDLIRREQDRIVPHLGRVVESALPENRGSGSATDRGQSTTLAIVDLGRAIDRFATDLIDRSHERRSVEAATRTVVRTSVLMDLNASLSEFAALSHVAAASPAIAPIVDAMSESLHALVTAVGEALADDGSGNDLALARALTDDRSGVIRRLRDRMVRSDDRIASEDLGLIYQMTGVLERSVWLLRHLIDDRPAGVAMPGRTVATP